MGEVETLYKCGERLSSAEDKSSAVAEFELIITTVKGGSTKAKQLAAQLVPRFIIYFPSLVNPAMSAMFDLIEDADLAVRVQAIRGLSLLCKDSSNYISKIIDVLVQLLTCEENVERDAVHKALMSLLRQDVKAALTALFKQVENNDESIREMVICFLKDKVFPLKAELLKPQVEMERHVTTLVKSLQDVTGAEFKLFIDFLKSFSIYGSNSPPEQVQELIQIIEGQADLNAQFDVAEERKLDLLKNLAGFSPYATAHDSRQLLPSIVQLLKKYMPRRKAEEANIDFVECLLFTFHHLSHKTPNSTNSLCGYKIVTGQPSDRLGEDFSDNNEDFTERLSATEEIVKDAMKKLTQGIAYRKKAMAAHKTEEEKATIKKELQKTASHIRMCHNILAMTQPLHLNAPTFIGDDTINLSWLPTKPSSGPASAGVKRAAPADSTGANTPLSKWGRGDGGMQSHIVNRPFFRGGNRPSDQGGRGVFVGPNRGGNNWRGRGWGNRGRGRGFW